MYTGCIYDQWMITFTKEFGQKFGIKDCNGEFYPFFKDFSDERPFSWAIKHR